MEQVTTSYRKYKKTYRTFSGEYVVNGGISKESLNSIIFLMNFEDKKLRMLNLDTLSNLENGYTNNKAITDRDKAIEEIINYNERAYVPESLVSKSNKPIELSMTIVDSEKSQTVSYIDKLLNDMSSLTTEEAKQAYNELINILGNKELKTYKNLTEHQTEIIKLIDLKVANFIYENKIDVKKYQKKSA